ncbi:HEPN family nuclease [Mesorhizobium sp.]|uniref:HEPN family nuclease n=1 Tax=Mesorhizobium sp. TaxID=1871066 RepID=UPI00345591C0
MPQFGRNETAGVAERTWTNFLLVQQTFEESGKGHVVTQLMCSMLGLVVFPWERSVIDRAKLEQLDKLVVEGWPRWQFCEGNCETLWDLIRNLRHSVAHSEIWFSTDSRNLNEVSIEFANYPRNRPRWKAQIRGDNLREFCMQFQKYISNVVD